MIDQLLTRSATRETQATGIMAHALPVVVAKRWSRSRPGMAARRTAKASMIPIREAVEPVGTPTRQVGPLNRSGPTARRRLSTRA